MRSRKFVVCFFWVILIFLVPKMVFATSDQCVTKTLLEMCSLQTPDDFGKINAIKSAKIINGVVIEQGKVFSFNDVVGEISRERGFTYGFTIFVNSSGQKEKVFDDGSGVWRISTALYRAARDLSLEVVERHPTYRPEIYTTVKESAIIKWDQGPGSNFYQDFKFKNNTDNQIMIKASVDKKGNVSIKIYKIEYSEK